MNRRLLIQQLELPGHLNQGLVDGKAGLNHNINLLGRNFLAIFQDWNTAFWAYTLVLYFCLEACLTNGVPTRHNYPWQPFTFKIMTKLLSAAFTNHFSKYI